MHFDFMDCCLYWRAGFRLPALAFAFLRREPRRYRRSRISSSHHPDGISRAYSSGCASERIRTASDQREAQIESSKAKKLQRTAPTAADFTNARLDT